MGLGYGAGVRGKRKELEGAGRVEGPGRTLGCARAGHGQVHPSGFCFLLSYKLQGSENVAAFRMCGA